MSCVEQFIKERRYLMSVSDNTIRWHTCALKWLPSENPTVFGFVQRWTNLGIVFLGTCDSGANLGPEAMRSVSVVKELQPDGAILGRRAKSNTGGHAELLPW